MEELIAEKRTFLDYGLAWAPFPGELISGDRALLLSNHDRALIAVIDGAGHGARAAQAAEKAAKVLTRSWRGPLEQLLLKCHEELNGTRGATASLVAIDFAERRLSWIGVGDVAAVLIQSETRAREALIPAPGILGYRFPRRLRGESFSMAENDLIILATDGVYPTFGKELAEGPFRTPNETARQLLVQYRNPKDDALVLVARVLEEDLV